MITVNSLDALANYGFDKVAVAFGVFDGIHLGHTKLIDKLICMSKQLDAKPVVVTFYPHPRSVLHPDEPLLLLNSRHKKIELLAKLGVLAVVTLPFTLEFSMLNPEEFLDNCLFAPGIEISGVCVGSKWRFGSKATGSVETLKRYAKNHGFLLEPVSELILNGKTVCSTAIRRAVSSGLLIEASEMLGRNYSLSGIVIHGENLASSKLKCPTANISVPNGIVPPDGVYAGIAHIDNDTFPAAISVGVSPTFSEKQRTSEDIEVHLLGFQGDLYSKMLEVEFIEYIREERCFPDSLTLGKQIQNDLIKITEVFEHIKGQNLLK